LPRAQPTRTVNDDDFLGRAYADLRGWLRLCPTAPVAPRSTRMKHKWINTFSTMIEAINNTNKQIFETLDWINLNRDFFVANFHHLTTKKVASKSNKGIFENFVKKIHHISRKKS
jgi:hypothetical protein